MKTKIYPITYPNTLRRHRKASGLRQHEVARALGLNGCERISKWENGHSIPKGKSLFKLAALYHVPLQQLFSEIYQSTPSAERMTEEETKMVQYDGPEPNAFWRSDPNDIPHIVNPISSSSDEAAPEAHIPVEV
jgi:transcriptional regulator with XRE-family HTH domain